MPGGHFVEAINMNLHLLAYLIVLMRLSLEIVGGNNILHFCTSGHVNATEVTIIKDRENTSLAVDCICDVQIARPGGANLSFVFPQTQKACVVDITFSNFRRCSQVEKAYKNTSFIYSGSGNIKYSRRKSNIGRTTGNIKIDLTTTSNTYVSVWCLKDKLRMITTPVKLDVTVMPGKGDTNDTRGSRTVPGGVLDKKRVIIIATLVPVLTVITAAVVALVILIKRRRAKYDEEEERSEDDLHEATYSLAEPRFIEKKHERKKKHFKKDTAKIESHQKSVQSADVYAQPIKEVKKGDKVGTKDVQEPVQDDYQEVTVPVPAKSKELMAATMYDDVRVLN